MAGPPQGSAMEASDRTPYSGRTSGAGGKIRSRHQNSVQDRRAITSVSVDNRDSVAAAARAGGAVRRGPYDRPTQGRHSSAGPQAAARRTAWLSMGSRIFTGASSFLTSFFRKEEQILVDNKPFELQDTVLERNESDADEIEDILKERAFTREQCDHLIQVLQSKMSDRSTQPLQNHIPNGLIEDRYPDDELERERFDGREKEQREGLVDATTADDELGSSPVDIAKAYMDKRLSPVPPLPVRTLDYGATRIREEYGATPPRVATPGHTPYVKLRNKIFDGSSRRTPYPVPSSIVREKKRRVDDDSDYSGRRTRLKTSAANGPPLSTLPSASNDIGNASYMSRMRNLQRKRVDKSVTEDIVGVAPVPTQSTETARKILETLEMLTPPKVKSLEEELAMVREKRPKELSPSMLNEQARKSMQDVECPPAEIATASTSTGMEPVASNRFGKPSSSESPPVLSVVQPVSTDVKRKGVRGAAIPSEDGPSISTAPTAKPTKGFRMNAALEESNSDDETPAPAPKKVSFSITTKPSDGLPKSGFTFPSANLLTEPPTPKPIPSPTLPNEQPKTSSDKAVQPIIEKSVPKESDSLPAVSQTKPVDFSSFPSTPISNGPEDGGKGAGSASSLFTTPPKATLSFPAINTENTLKTSEPAPSLFGLTKSTTNSILSDSNGIFHQQNNALGPPAEEVMKSGQGSSAAVSTALSSDAVNGIETKETKSPPVTSSLFNFASSSSYTSFGASASTLDTKPVVDAPLSTEIKPENKLIFGFVSSSSSPVLESKPPTAFPLPSSSAAAEPISKPVTSASESKPTVTENKPISPFGGPLSTSAFQFNSSASFGSTVIAPSSSSSPETTAAPLMSSSSSPVLFTSGTSSSTPFPSFSSGPASSTPFPAFNFGSNTASNANTSSSPASFVFSASSGSASTGMPFGATIFGASTSASTSGATVSTFTFGTQSSGLSGSGSTGTTSGFVFGSSNVFTGFGSTSAPSSVSSPTGDMMEDMAEEPSQAGANTTQSSISPPNLFGSTPAQTPAQPFVFGGNQTTSLFGGPQPSTPVFGASQPQQSTPIFGASQSQPSTPLFGASQPQPSNPVFGASQSQPSIPVFGSPQSQPSFVAQPAPAFGSSAPSFGAPPTPAFGAPTFGAQPFGGAPPAFGAPAGQAASNPFSTFAGGFSMGASSTDGEKRKIFKAKRTGAAKRGK